MPATTPLPTSILTKIAARSQAVRWTVMLKEVRTFSAYCCDIDSDGIMGVKKQPVIILDIDLSTCLGEGTKWDFTDSYAPGSTITAWEIDFGDSTSSVTGSNIADAHGTHDYAAIGSYTVTVSVTEGTGLQQEIEREVNVVDCPSPPPSWMYAGTKGGGVWFIDWRDETPAWKAKTGGLVGSASLDVNSLIIRPGTKHTESQELWIATSGGIYHSNKNGDYWDKIPMGEPSNAEFEDTSPATEADLEWIHIAYSPVDEDILYALARKV